MDKVRAFIAVALSDEIRLKLKEAQDHLKKFDADIRWVDPKNIHLTLKFIGDVPADSVEKLCEAVQESINNFPAFEFELNHLGCFPPKGTPRVIWIGVGSGHDFLEEIVSKLSDRVSSFCAKKEDEKFSAHATLGRVKSDKNIHKLLSVLKEPSLQIAEKQKVDHITLLKSDLTSSGPIYSEIKIFRLCNK